MNTGRVIAVVGGQYGSEGKGVVAAEVSSGPNVGACIRTGGPNAGHSFMRRIAGGGFSEHIQQQLPCGWFNERAALVLGPGAVVSEEILLREIAVAERSSGDVGNRVFVDHRATVLLPEHAASEGHTAGEIHARIGSTGEGVGAARMAKLSRGAMGDVTWGHRKFSHLNTPAILRECVKSGRDVVLEGTQGFGLSLHLGRWPYVTSANCTAAQLCSDAGLPPAVDEVIMVVRTLPIRVAGNSGQLPDELSWSDVSRGAGRDVEERTTVTRKVRRVAKFDPAMVGIAAEVNGATAIVLTFGDYLDGGKNCGVVDASKLGKEIFELITLTEDITGIPVVAVGTGYDTARGWQFVDFGLSDMVMGGAP